MNKKKRKMMRKVIVLSSLLFTFVFLIAIFSFLPTGKVTVISPIVYTFNKTITVTPSECSNNGGTCILFTNNCSEGYTNANFACNTRSEKCCMKEDDPIVNVPTETSLLLKRGDKFVASCSKIIYVTLQSISYPYIQFRSLISDKRYMIDLNRTNVETIEGAEYTVEYINNTHITISSNTCTFSIFAGQCNTYSSGCKSSLDCCSKICQNAGCDFELKKIIAPQEMGLWCQDTEPNTPTIKLVYIYNDTSSFSNDRVEFINLVTGENYKTHWTAEGVGSIVVQGKTYVVHLIGDKITIQPIMSGVCNIHYSDSFIVENIGTGETHLVGALTLRLDKTIETNLSYSATFYVTGDSQIRTLTKENPNVQILINGKNYVVQLLYANKWVASFKATYVIPGSTTPICSPTTCSALGSNCGTWSNGTCAGTLDCGTCGLGEVCMSGVCTVSKGTTVELPGEKETQETDCDGCSIENMCLPYGYRLNELYCGLDKNLINQSISGTCDNNFECRSNVCVNSKCASPGLVQRFMDWFARFFRSK